MIHKPIDAISIDDLQGLIESGVRESRTIEYKRDLPGHTDEQKKEFLADVSSFANAAGGDLIYGMEAKDGVPRSIPGLSNFNKDSESLRLESTIRDGIEPRIPGVRLKAVRGVPDAPVLVLRVPQSWCGSHMVTFKGTSRFFSRASTGKFPMDVDQVGAAFQAAGDVPEQMRRWRDERLGRILANEGPVPLAPSPCLVVHLVPFESLANQWRLLASEMQSQCSAFPPMSWSASSFALSHRLNVDGLMTFFGAAEARRAYTQLFRSGRVEAADTRVFESRDGAYLFNSSFYEQIVIEAVGNYLMGLKALDLQPPIVFLLTIIGAKGACLVLKGPLTEYSHPIDREMLIVPDVLIEDYACDIPRVLRPAFDAVWNACGFAQSPNYDEDGNWSPR